jgi:hypothetical protein
MLGGIAYLDFPSCYNNRMRDSVRSVYWEAPEHHHLEKTSDWYWILGIIAVAAAVASVLIGNVLFAIVIILASGVMMLHARREPRMFGYEISNRGVRIQEYLYPFSNLESFYLDEDYPLGPQLIVKPKNLLSSILIIPIPEEYLDDIEHILAPRLREEHLEEPLAHRVMQHFGF